MELLFALPTWYIPQQVLFPLVNNVEYCSTSHYVLQFPPYVRNYYVLSRHWNMLLTPQRMLFRMDWGWTVPGPHQCQIPTNTNNHDIPVYQTINPIAKNGIWAYDIALLQILNLSAWGIDSLMRSTSLSPGQLILSATSAVRHSQLCSLSFVSL